MSDIEIRKTRIGNDDYPKDFKFLSNIRTTRSSSACDNMFKKKSICSKNNKGKEVDKMKDRNYLNSSKKSIIHTKIITKKEYESLKERGRVITQEEKQAAAEIVEKKKEKLIKQSMERKEAIRRLDMKRGRVKDPRTKEIEEEARKRTMHILERAHNMRLEQEEEIQKCNRFILETKCRAIRDAQIAERKLIEEEVLEEEQRLNNMMENERRWAIKEEVRKEQEETAKRLHFAKILKDQITENEEQRILEFERKQEESRLINLSNIAWQQDEIEKLRNKAIENAKVRRELSEVNKQLKHFKMIEQEENKIIDLRIQNYHRLRDEIETKKAEQQRLENLRKEREKARVAVQAMQAHELQAQIDEINAARIQEEVEREWRKKEKEEALKRLETQKILRKEREEQMSNKRIMQAIEIERDRQEYEKIVRVQQEAFCREKKELEDKQRKALIHHNEILKQISEKEKERIVERQKTFEEGITICAEITMRKKRLQDAMERKCQEMKDNKVPDIYMDEIKRMIENIK